jgi:hypothetical protein
VHATANRSLEEVSVPVITVVPGHVRWRGEATTRRARQGRFIAADARTDLVWLKDRAETIGALGHLVARLAGHGNP